MSNIKVLNEEAMQLRQSISWQVKSINESKLRQPQKAASYACLSYEQTQNNNRPAIVCMPTGSGKSAVIGTLIFHGEYKKTLILVPSDALRKQTSESFIQSGLEKYKTWEVLEQDSIEPIVSIVSGNLVEDDFLKVNDCDIVIATAQSIMVMDTSTREAFLKKFERVVFDEAHHEQAAQWNAMSDTAFKNGSSVFQFTATPYRLDAKKISGQIIFRYSIKQACDDGMFARIKLEGVQEYYDHKKDEVLARKAIEILNSDLEQKFDHVLMVKAANIKQAKVLFELYKTLTDLPIELIHSRIKPQAQQTAIEKLQAGETRVVVCVNMLAEGFDLPNFKICAMHSHRKSLPIFLQLMGRFTRVSQSLKLGDATIVANTVDDEIIDSFKELYALDSDWNSIIHRMNEEKIDDEFYSDKISDDIDDLSLKNLIASNDLSFKCSAQLFKTTETLPNLLMNANVANYLKDNFENSIVETFDNDSVGIILAKSYEPVGWASSKDFLNSLWTLIVFYKKDSFVFINSQDRGLIVDLAKITSCEQVVGKNIFRIFNDLELAVFANVGLINTNVDANFIMRVGKDVMQALDDAERAQSDISNIFGHGHVCGQRTSLGASRKGIFWSMTSTKVNQWMQWCDSAYQKIMDESIPDQNFFRGMMRSKKVASLGDVQIHAVSTYKVVSMTQRVTLKILKSIDGIYSTNVGIDDFEIALDKHDYGSNKIDFSVILYLQGYGYERPFRIKCGWTIESGFSIQDRSSLAEFKIDWASNGIRFLENLELSAWTTNYEFLTLNQKELYSPVLNAQIEQRHTIVIDWTGVNCSAEAWNYGSQPNSVQGKMIELIKLSPPSILFYDDGANELADLVGFTFNDALKEIKIELYHCKYSSTDNAGVAVGNFNELVQQALSSIQGLMYTDKMVAKLIHREGLVQRNSVDKTRFILGNMEDLKSLKMKIKHYTRKIEINLVQPGLSNRKFLAPQGERIRTVLASTAAILKKTLNAETKFYINE